MLLRINQNFPFTLQQENALKLKKAFLWFVHTFGILEAPILYFRGNFIASASGTTVGGKGLNYSV
jgi:hypothetical protein